MSAVGRPSKKEIKEAWDKFYKLDKIPPIPTFKGTVAHLPKPPRTTKNNK